MHLLNRLILLIAITTVHASLPMMGGLPLLLKASTSTLPFWYWATQDCTRGKDIRNPHDNKKLSARQTTKEEKDILLHNNPHKNNIDLYIADSTYPNYAHACKDGKTVVISDTIPGASKKLQEVVATNDVEDLHVFQGLLDHCPG